MKNVFVIIAIIISMVGTSQNNENLQIIESTVFKDQIKSDSIPSVYPLKNGGLAIVRPDKDKIYVDVFEKQLTKRFTNYIKIEKKDTYLGNVFFDNQIHVITEHLLNKDTKVLRTYAYNLDSKSTKKFELSRTIVDKKLSLYSNKKGSSYAISPNLNFIGLVTYTIHKGEIHFHTSVFATNNYELIYEKQITRPENSFYEIEDIQVDNDKNVFVFGKTFYDSISPQIKNEDKQYYFLEKFTSSDYSKLEINFSDKYIKTLKAVKSNSAYKLYGFYSNEDISQIKGILSVSIDLKQNKITDTTFQNLPDKVYSDMFGKEKIEKRKSQELTNFDFNHILNDSDSGIYLLAEEKDSSGGGNIGAPGSGTTSGGGRVIYGNVLIIKINKSGEIEWGASIFKNDSEPSYNAFLKNDELHVLLNSGKDLKIQKDGRTKLSKGFLESSSLYDFKFTSSGSSVINKIQDNKNNDYYLPNFGKHTNNIFIMFNESKKKRKFIILK